MPIMKIYYDYQVIKIIQWVLKHYFIRATSTTPAQLLKFYEKELFSAS